MSRSDELKPYGVYKVEIVPGSGLVLYYCNSSAIMTEFELLHECREFKTVIGAPQWCITEYANGLIRYWPGDKWSKACSFIVAQNVPGYELALAWRLRYELGE